MIPVERIAQNQPRSDAAQPLEVDNTQPLDDEAEMQLDFADSKLEEAAARMKPGDDMCHAELMMDEAPSAVLWALKCRWEGGGWIVGVFQIALDAVRVVLARPREMPVSRAVVQEALAARGGMPASAGEEEEPARTGVPAKTPRMSNPLLIRMPTRGRPAQALACLAQYRALAVDHPPIEVVIDEDDETMCCSEVYRALSVLDCVVTVGRHKSKVEAVNAGRVDDFATLLLASDDMWPVAQGYDRRIVELMAEHWPLNDGAITLNDAYNVEHRREGKPVLCTLPILGRHLLEREMGGLVYSRAYKSLFADDEQTEVLTSMKRMHFVDELLIEHRHHAAGKAPVDALYRHNDSFVSEDRATYERRAAEDFNRWPTMLSILICTIPEREAQMRRLVDWLRAQIAPQSRQIEICVDARVGVTVGEKRQALLERAIGAYCAFIDDDDWVPADYVARIFTALLANPGVDCLSLSGVMTTDGQRPEKFEHSIKYGVWYTENGVHYRSPNHLSCLRRELALKVGFDAANVGEDHSFSKRLRPLLKTEASTGPEPLYFYWNVPSKSVQRKAK